MIQYFHLKGLIPTNIKAELDSTLGGSAPSFTKIKYWMAEFKRGRTSCQDENRNGLPNEVTSTEMVKKIHKMILDDRWLKVRKLADMKGISQSTKGFSNRDITILSMNKTQKYLRYWVEIYCGCSASITFYEWNSISVIWPPRAGLQRSILWTQFSTTLAHISTGKLAISRWMLSLRSSKVAGLLA